MVAAAFLGGGPQLTSPDMIHSPADRSTPAPSRPTHPPRYRLRTHAAGTVLLSLHVITRHFDKYGVDL